MTQTARTTAVAKHDQSIADNVTKIEKAKRPNALESMAARLNISASSLSNTLRATVFKDANDDQFAALIIVANEYQLNPLTKEIYAFPAKGGIVPMVSIDGWVSIMNRQPMFDGIEFNDLPDANGRLYAIEAVIWRKDRSRAIKVTEYLEECKRNTDPWNKSPCRMLRHRALMQCARYAFGFSGIYGDEGELTGDIQLVSDSAPPMRGAAYVAHNPETGEIIDQSDDGDNHESTDQADPQTGVTIHSAEAKADEIIAAAGKCATLIDLNALKEREADNIMAMPDEIAPLVEGALNGAEARLRGL